MIAIHFSTLFSGFLKIIAQLYRLLLMSWPLCKPKKKPKKGHCSKDTGSLDHAALAL